MEKNLSSKDTKQDSGGTKGSGALRIVLLVAIVAILVLVTWKLFGSMLPQLLKLIRKGDEKEIARFLDEQGRWKGLLSVFLLSVIQVISVVIPGIIIQFTAGMIFPWWEAFLMAYLGFVFANTMVFIFARIFRHSVKADQKKAGWIISTVNKYDPAFVFALACLVPGIPNGVIPYFAAAAKLSVKEYAASVALSSWVQILSNTVAGHFMIRGKIVYTILSFVAQIAIILLCGINRKRILEKFGRIDPKAAEKKENSANPKVEAQNE